MENLNEEQLWHMLHQAEAMAWFCVVMLVAFFILLTLHDLLNSKAKKDYVKTLNEHDKSIIATYTNTTFLRKTKK